MPYKWHKTVKNINFAKGKFSEINYINDREIIER